MGGFGREGEVSACGGNDLLLKTACLLPGRSYHRCWQRGGVAQASGGSPSALGREGRCPLGHKGLALVNRVLGHGE